MAPEYIFGCKKCEHVLYINKFYEKTISNLPNTHCPNCGEEGYLNWIAMGEGDFADYEGEKIEFKQEDTHGGSVGCCGKHQHSNEKGF
jgi:hypothetical protein